MEYLLQNEHPKIIEAKFRYSLFNLFHYYSNDFNFALDKIRLKEFYDSANDFLLAATHIKTEYIVIEIGMNSGFSTLRFAADPRCQQVYSYELNKAHYSLALYNLLLNPSLINKVKINHVELHNFDNNLFFQDNPINISSKLPLPLLDPKISHSKELDQDSLPNLINLITHFYYKEVKHQHPNTQVILKIEHNDFDAFNVFQFIKDKELLKSIDIVTLKCSPSTTNHHQEEILEHFPKDITNKINSSNNQIFLLDDINFFLNTSHRLILSTRSIETDKRFFIWLNKTSQSKYHSEISLITSFNYKINIKNFDRCLNSLVNQSLRNIEIILIEEDPPNYDYEQVLARYQDERFHIVKLHHNKGKLALRNVGVVNSTSEYIIFINGEDYIDHNFCENLIQTAQKINADVVVYPVKCLNALGFEEDKFDLNYTETITKNSFHDRKWLPKIVTMMCKRSIYDQIMANVPDIYLDFAVDILQSLFILYYTNLIVTANNSFYYHLIHENFENNFNTEEDINSFFNSLVNQLTHLKTAFSILEQFINHIDDQRALVSLAEKKEEYAIRYLQTNPIFDVFDELRMNDFNKNFYETFQLNVLTVNKIANPEYKIKISTRKKIYIHIGTHKSGTTSIQEFCKKNDARLNLYGVKYVNTGQEICAHNGISGVFMEDHLPYDYRDHDPVKLMSQLYQEIKNSSFEKYIISSEGFWHYKNINDFALLAQTLSEFEIIIVAYLRRQDDFLESYFQQEVKASNVKDLTDLFKDYRMKLDYYSVLKDFMSLFRIDKRNLIIRIYEHDQLYQGDVVKDFLNTIGINNLKFNSFRANEAFHPDLIQFKKIVNHLPLAELKGYSIYSDAIHQAQHYLKPIKKHKFIPEEESLAILKQYEESNKKIAIEFLNKEDGILFTQTPPNREIYSEMSFASLIEVMVSCLEKVRLESKQRRGEVVT